VVKWAKFGPLLGTNIFFPPFQGIYILKIKGKTVQNTFLDLVGTIQVKSLVIFQAIPDLEKMAAQKRA
jgi:hypothetical protein